MVQRWRKTTIAGVAMGVAALIWQPSVDASPVARTGHTDMAWTVTSADGGQPPDSFGGAGRRPWAGLDRVWNQPGFTGAYTIVVNGREVPAYCGDFHNARSPDRSSEWLPDRGVFQGSDKALTKLSYAQWRWGATTDPDTGAALNMYTHFLGSPGDRSNSNGVPIPDINDNDLLDEIVTTLPPHAGVAAIMYVIDAEAEAWSAAFDHVSANVAAGMAIELMDGSPVTTSVATGRPLPSATVDLVSVGRRTTATTAGVAQPLRDITAGSQHSITAGIPQTVFLDLVPDIEVTSQISDVSPPFGALLTDEIRVTGLLDGESATVTVELFDLAADPAGSGPALATEVRSGVGNGTSAEWAPFDVTLAVAGHRLGYRHRLEAIEPAPGSAGLPGDWSELGILSETGTVDAVQAEVHLRKTVSAGSQPEWFNAQRGTEPSHRGASASLVGADGSHDDGPPDEGDALPVFVDGEEVSFRYEIWLDDASTGDVAWPTDVDAGADVDAAVDAGTGPRGDDIVSDDGGTPTGDDDFVPTYVEGDNGDGRLSVDEVWVFEASGQRRAVAGERYINTASVEPGAIVNPATGERSGAETAARSDPAGYVVPCLSTSVADRSDGDRVLDAGDGVVVDVATYCNLIPGESYVIEGGVVVQATGESTSFRGSTTFVPETSDGSVSVEIEVDVAVEIEAQADGALVAGDYVVFETVTLAATGDVVAVHADLDDEAQTFTVRPIEAESPESTSPPPTSEPDAPPATTTPATTTTTTTTTSITTVIPPPAGPPTAALPPAIPKVGSDATHLAMLAGLALFTAGVVAMEARHGRVRRSPGVGQVR